jgi:cellulose synthase (UDP-forming)
VAGEAWPAPLVAPGRRRSRAPSRRRDERYLIPAASLPVRLPLYLVAGAWVVALAFFWRWWLAPGHWSTVGGMAVNSAVLGFELVVLPAWWFFFMLRMRRPNPDLGLPFARAAIVVTKAPSEPWSVVRKTLRAMLAQDYPHLYDVWLADEDPTDEVRRWCTRHGVGISTRRGVSEYHRPRWPRCTRCKEGNLAYFYDHYGYERYDVVAQLDADHVPEADYLRHMVAPFADPRVGYVAAPSICDANADRSWSARGRLFAEAVLHGPTQAGCSGDYAPSCIGSHYAVRTRALEQIGGLGPELAEDFSTTLMMNAGGWRGVFAIDAIAHGDGPECVADCVTQDFQWARSMTNIMLRVTPRHWRKLSVRAKVKLGFCQLWYPLNGLVMLAMVALPAWSLLARTPLMRVSLGTFYLHFMPTVLAGLAGMFWLRRRGLLRPPHGRPLSWEALLFQFVRWPWALLGCLQALVDLVTRREFDFKVTPKGGGGARSLPTVVLLPYLLLAAISLLPALLIRDAGEARGYYFWSLMNGAIYLLVAVAIVILHVRENRPIRISRPALRLAGLQGLGIAAVAAAVVAASHLHGAQALAVLVPRSQPDALPVPAFAAPYPIAQSPPLRIELGVTTETLAASATVPWTPVDLREVNRFEQDARAHVGIVMWYADWVHDKFNLSHLEAVAARGSTPEISWEPWDASKPLHRAQPAFSLASIIAGSHDAYIRSWAEGLRLYGKPVLLRFAQEMNGTWYPWSEVGGWNSPGQYAQAWRHVHDIFSAVGASNVRWIWSPVAGPIKPELYPGDRYVDIIGLSGFNGGGALQWGGWKSFATMDGPSLDRLHALAPSKPIEISEVGTAEAGGSKATWIANMFAELKRRPYVASLLWFNLHKQTDWRIESSPAATAAFAAGLRTLATSGKLGVASGGARPDALAPRGLRALPAGWFASSVPAAAGGAAPARERTSGRGPARSAPPAALSWNIASVMPGERSPTGI